MRRWTTLAAFAVVAALTTGNARAEELRGRLAVTGKVGISIPTDSERRSNGDRIVVESDPGLVLGGGILYGLDDNVAFELDLARSAYHTGAWQDAEVKNLSVGAQYRFPERSRLVPYLGAGVDILINDLDDPAVSAVDTTFGLHISGGVDYILNRNVVLNLEAKGVEAFAADVKSVGGGKIGSLDPSNLSFTAGARFFFN